MIDPYIQYMYSYPHKTAYGPLRGIDLREAMQALRCSTKVMGQFPDCMEKSRHSLDFPERRMKGQQNSLYFHIPFCPSKCGYCNLFSLAGERPERMEAYVDAMERQAGQLGALLPEGAEFQDLTLGGGTPLFLPVPLLERIFDMAEKHFSFQTGKYSEVVETSPNQTDREKLSLLKERGVTRISIGVQSFFEEELRTLRRLHGPRAAREALAAIKEADFSCLNVDLIYGIPGQTKESFVESLKQALYFQPDELFVYPLYVKPETELYRLGVRRSEDAREMYETARDLLLREGYEARSMRRFVKMTDKSVTADKSTMTDKSATVVVASATPVTASAAAATAPVDGKTATGEDGLCGFGNTLSVGCGGRSYLGRLHFCTPYAVRQKDCLEILRQYIEKEDYTTVEYGFLLDEEEEKRRYAIRHILFGKGIDRADYRNNFQKDVLEDFPEFVRWMEEGYAVQTESHISLTAEGMALSDYLGPQLISENVREKMRKWGREHGADPAVVL